MYQNAIYICISWYNKICWFTVKKCWCQQNSGGVSRDLYIFWIFFRLRYNSAKFHHCRICVTDFRQGLGKKHVEKKNVEKTLQYRIIGLEDKL